ncbi:MAG: TIGR02099 family protein [Arenimonas sp.]|nr:TIGR02099 family protein [Arenimonas sp.]
MTTPLRRRIRHARRWTGYGVLVLLIGLALLVGVANQLLPMVERHPEKIAAWLSERVGEPVSFSHARAEWTRRGPRFILDGLHVGEGETQLDIGRAQLQVAMYSGLFPGRPLTELKIRDLALTLVQDKDGRWKVIGLPGQKPNVDPLDRLEGFGELQIEKARLAIRAPRLKIEMNMPRIDARVRVNGPRVRVGVSAWVERGDPPLSAVLDFQRQRRDGLLWVGGKKLSLAHWSPVLASVGVKPERGSVDLALWTQLRDQRISQVTVQAQVTAARLRATKPIKPADGNGEVEALAFDEIRASARWSATANGWRIHAPQLNFTEGGKIAHLDQLVIDGGRQFSLSGRELDLSPLAAVLSLSDRVPDSVRQFLQQSRPQAVLRDVAISGRRDGPVRGSMAVSSLSLQASGKRPGVSGLAGHIRFDERGGVMRLDSSPIHVAWPLGLRQPVDFRLSGTLALWRTSPGWTLGSSSLRLRGEDFGAALRMQLGFQGDGTAPTLDLAANLDPATFVTAKKFWILHKMPAATVRWLDAALLSGAVTDGRIAIGGDLDDWPFRNHGGNFEALAKTRDAALKFDDEWPVAEHLDLDLAFNSIGFSLQGSGSLMDNRIASVAGGIAEFHEPLLSLDIDAKGSGEKLRLLMISSPLNQEYGEHLRAVTLRGDATVALALRLPLNRSPGEKRIDGTVDLSRASLADSRWDIAFTDVSGRTRFSRQGFATENLSVRLSNQPGIFNLRVGADTGDKDVAAIATLDGRFTAATLIDRYADLAWLKPWVAGASNWKLAIRIPVEGKPSRDEPSQLLLTSDLVGTAITMPEPMKKAEQASLQMELRAPLPIERGEINLRLGEIMRLRGRVRKDLPLTGTIQLGEGPIADPPAQGLSVRGNAALLDSTGWVGFSAKGESSSTLHDIDVQAAKLIFIDRAFADTHLQLRRDSASTQVQLKGNGIEGSIDIPSEISRGVRGRFAVLHMPSDDPGAAQKAPATVDVEDPAALPPMQISITDLRLGQAQLGKAELVTTPIPAGMRVDKFQTRAKNMSLDAAGEWVRAGKGTHSNFQLSFNASSLGQMLDSLGYKEMVEGGKTKATLAGSWPGSPGAFALAVMSGTLKAEVGEGRLVNVEPGGSGRVLGLLSLAEIPRRLSLDFSDFFQKGFSFNSARGDFVFSDGKARTDNLRIDGPAAEIRVSGTTGFREMVYDQRVEVLPKAGGILPALGLLAGGPAGAAVGAMAQAVLQKPLKQTTRVVYSVMGPWQKPVVKVIEKGPDRNAATGKRDTPVPVQP